MANVLSDTKRHQVLALGRLGWALRRIEEAPGVRRETASAYLKAAGIEVRPERHRLLPAKPASEVSTDSGAPTPRPTAAPGSCARPAPYAVGQCLRAVPGVDRRHAGQPAA